MRASRTIQKAEWTLWKAIGLSIPLTVKVFLRGRMGNQTIKWYMCILAPLYTWLFLSAFEGEEWFRIPTLTFNHWGANVMTVKEVIIYLIPLLCLFQWVTSAKDEEGHERGESLFWGSLEGENLERPVIRQWLDPLLPLVMASLFYAIDFRLFLFFAIGAAALFIEEMVYNSKEYRGGQLQKANIGRERRRMGLDPKGSSKKDEAARPVQLVTHQEQSEYNQT